ncbi:MAG: ribosome biogenesis factor YjgA [Desulfobacterales bacterium]|nr:ribosome biogenesis factor YjgA [Desulfobacterales bacterium]
MGDDQIMENDFKSKTQKKNEDQLLQKLGEQLVDLPPERTDQMDMPDELREALVLARNTPSHGARRRQVKYIGTLLRQVDTAPLSQALSIIQRGDYLKAQAFKKIGLWRDALKTGDLSLVDEILSACPDADRGQLTQLARNAKNEAAAAKGSKASRALFRYLRQVSGEYRYPPSAAD